MPTVPDLCKAVGAMRGANESELRQVARTLQAARMLPKANPRQRRTPPEITPKDCATFLIGLACASPSGSRTPDILGPRVQKFQKLIWERPDGTRMTFLNALLETIDKYRDPNWQNDPDREEALNRITFIIDDAHPQAEIEADRIRENDQNYPTLRHAFVSKRDLDPTANPALGPFDRFAHSYVFGPDVFFTLWKLLGSVEPREGDG